LTKDGSGIARFADLPLVSPALSCAPFLLGAWGLAAAWVTGNPAHAAAYATLALLGSRGFAAGVCATLAVAAFFPLMFSQLVVVTGVAALGAAVVLGRNTGPRLARWKWPVLRVVLPLVLLTALFRSFSPWSPLLLAAALVVLGWPELRAHAAWPRRTALFTALLTLLSVLFSVGLAEAGARLLWARDRIEGVLLEPDPRYGFLLGKDARAEILFSATATESKTVRFDLSEQGLRDRVYGPKPPGTTRVLLLGDSFTMGHTVALPYTFSRCLERRVREALPGVAFEAVNGGINCAGPLQELGMLLERGLPLEPDFVVLQLFPSNDLDDMLIADNRCLRSFHRDAHRVANRIRRRAWAGEKIERWLQHHSALYQQVRRVTGYKDWATRLAGNLRVFPQPKAGVTTRLKVAAPPFLDINRRDPYPELAEAFDELADRVAEMESLCRAHGAGFAVFLIPDYHELDLKYWNEGLEKVDHPDQFERYRANRTLEGALRAHGIDAKSYYSLEDAVRAASDRAGPDDIVLLSPGCASYDMFANYTERGEAFRKAARTLGAK